MGVRNYDSVVLAKLQRWMPEQNNLRILGPNENKRLFEINADDKDDKKISLPLIALSRNNDIELKISTKTLNSYNGLKLDTLSTKTAVLNTIPIKLNYQLDIYTKTADEADEYVRNFLFKLINNPKLQVNIPYNGYNYTHTANIKVDSNVADTSDIAEKIFAGQFYRWTINFEILDAFLFNIPFKNNWTLINTDLNIADSLDLDLADSTEKQGELEEIWKNKY